MKWTYAIKNKLLASLLLFIALGMVLLNNIVERRHSERINKAIETIYDDRLVVESYIYHYADLLHRIVEASDTNSAYNNKAVINHSIAKIELLNQAYAKTKLTPDETISFNAFTDLCREIKNDAAIGDLEQCRLNSKEALTILNTLSAIQLKEGKAQMTSAEKMYKSSSIFSRFELVVILVIVIFVQALVFASKTLQSKIRTPTSLN